MISDVIYLPLRSLRIKECIVRHVLLQPLGQLLAVLESLITPLDRVEPHKVLLPTVLSEQVLSQFRCLRVLALAVGAEEVIGVPYPVYVLEVSGQQLQPLEPILIAHRALQSELRVLHFSLAAHEGQLLLVLLPQHRLLRTVLELILLLKEHTLLAQSGVLRTRAYVVVEGRLLSQRELSLLEWVGVEPIPLRIGLHVGPQQVPLHELPTILGAVIAVRAVQVHVEVFDVVVLDDVPEDALYGGAHPGADGAAERRLGCLGRLLDLGL